MCGITGAVWTRPEKAPEHDTLQRMSDSLRRRGPDGEGAYVADFRPLPGREALPGVALGHRRLAILDRAGAHQPVGNEDGSVWAVGDGEIYNFRDLRRRLEGAGHRFRTDGDTETLLHLYEDEGPAFLKHLRGIFALAVWDARRRQLLLARDRSGQKPLLYRHEPGRLLFASELKALLEVPGVPRQIDPQALDEYLTYGYVPHPRTIFRGMAKLPPGCCAVYRNDRLEVHRYWQPDFNREEHRPAEDYAGQLRETLTSSVDSCLEGEVPFGALLSGGIESAIVVGLMRELTGEPVRTFAVGSPVRRPGQTRSARTVAERLGTVHEEIPLEPEPTDILSKLVRHFDEPLGDASAVTGWCVSEFIRRQVRVVFCSAGADELFAGRPRYRAAWRVHWLDRLPAAVRRTVAGRWWQKLPAGRRWRRFVEGLGRSPQRRYLGWMTLFDEARRGELYTTDFVATLPEIDPAGFLAAAFRPVSRRDPITAAGLADLSTSLPCNLLSMVDCVSAAHGLHFRQPFLDHRVVELAAQMPGKLKFRRGRGKRILREAFADLLPGPVRRPSKTGFRVPLDHWFRDQLKHFAREILLDPQTLARGYFHHEAVARLLDDHQSGRFDHGIALWALLILELWQRQRG